MPLRKNVVVSNKENVCVSLKASIFALEALLLGQIFVLRTSNFRGAAISR